jgi:hypothetical protein
MAVKKKIATEEPVENQEDKIVKPIEAEKPVESKPVILNKPVPVIPEKPIPIMVEIWVIKAGQQIMYNGKMLAAGTDVTKLVKTESGLIDAGIVEKRIDWI